jgi:perosamine synthetase
VKIPFEPEFRQKYFDLLEGVFDSNFWSEGRMTADFEAAFARFVGLGPDQAAAVVNCGLGLIAVLEAVGVAGGEVIVPSNTFMATPLAAERAGAKVVFADCNRYDLCLSARDLERRITPETKAVVVVHIGGHIAFDIDQIVELCAAAGVPLIEDCAHPHGAAWRGRAAGTFGLAGVYSFYATKTMPLGEGGMVVSRNPEIIEYVKKWRNYGKFDYEVRGLNARMNEVTAALGLIQLERLPELLVWKRCLAAKYDQIFDQKVELPAGMTSGYYKYIVFDTPLKELTGPVFGEACHRIMGHEVDLPDTDWVVAHHACPPMFPGWDGADLDVEGLRARLLT